MCVCGRLILFFFFKQKTAYEMRISDWSSDVCSSDPAPTNKARRSSPGTLLAVVSPDDPRLAIVMQIPEHLLLPFMVLGDREGHQLVQGQAILAIDLQQLRTDSAQAKPLLHHMGRHAEPHADF